MDLDQQKGFNKNLEAIVKNSEEIESDDDVSQLSAETLKALQAFYAENENKTETDIDEDWVE